MSNSRSKDVCKLKRDIRDRKIEIGANTSIVLAMGTFEMNDPILSEMNREFWKTSLRHGNSRKSYAKDKVDSRKSERMKLKEEIRNED